jgi:hypothetical protein
MHSFPSTGDAKSIWQAVWNKETTLLTELTCEDSRMTIKPANRQVLMVKLKYKFE